MKTKLFVKIFKMLYKPILRGLLVDAAEKTDNEIDDKLIGILDKFIKRL